jgi:hypothetical protein
MVGHSHLVKCLQSQAIPSALRNIVINLISDNETIIQTRTSTTQAIQFKRGVLQGSPLSPLLFNLSINYVLEELTDPDYAKQYGYSLTSELLNLTAMNFADDTANLSNSKQGIAITIEKTIELFQQSGLSINPSKSICICIELGKHVVEDIILSDGTLIPSLKDQETVRYLGVDFNSQLTFDNAKVINSLTTSLNKLVATPMLRPHQKITIINDYIWPTLVYPLQMAPLNKLPKSFLQDVDRVIRSSVKEILSIPTDTPNAMLYASKNLRGLSITKSEWEAFLQHYNICLVLVSANDPYIPYARDLLDEMQKCEQALNFTEREVEDMKKQVQESKSKTKDKVTKKMRDALREREYQDWSKLKLRGIGVIQYADNPKGNKSLMDKTGLTTTEYVTLLKMNANVTSVRAIPGRSLDGNQCRHCCAEKETLAHVLGSCPRGGLIRNHRHNTIRQLLAKSMNDVGFEVAEEVHCIADGGSTRRIDIIAYNSQNKEGYILDPTVRFESGNCEEQSLKVDEEKKGIYEPCINYFKNAYNLEHIEVIGLYVGARGTIPKFVQSFVSRFGLRGNIVHDIMMSALRGSIQIYNHHLNT